MKLRLFAGQLHGPSSGRRVQLDGVRRVLRFLFWFVLASPLALAQKPGVILRDPVLLAGVKEACRATDKAGAKYLKEVRRRADLALQVQPMTVTDKVMVPPSGDKHDYLSHARYWWPDPSKPDGLPYIRKDGETNPEIEKIPDHQNFAKLVSSVELLGLAFYICEDETYAEHAIHLLRVWFLDPATKMNPNLAFAQGVPGREVGRSEGILDFRDLSSLVDALRLLESSKSWSPELRKGFSSWFTDYLKWVGESKLGLQESDAKNNHGTWFDVQMVALRLYVGDEAGAKKIIETAKQKRIAAQINPDGSQPEELSRTKSWDYSVMNLEAFFRLASLSKKVGIDLWNYSTSDGRSIRKAFDYLLPFLRGEKTWAAQQIAPIKFDPLYPLLLRAAREYGRDDYTALARGISMTPTAKIYAQVRSGVLE